jgi:site-specific recombinase XerD
MKKKEQSGTEPSPLGPALARFALALEDGGYPKSTRDQYVAICRKFDAYLARRGIAPAELRDDHLDAFLVDETAGRKLREGGRLKRQFWRRPITLLLEQLRAEGLVPPAPQPADVLGPGLAEYLAFLREHRGMSERTVERQRLQVSRLLTHLGVRTEDELARISIEQIDRYLVHASRGLARQSMGAVCSSIRGFLGHLRMRGVLRSDLRAQVSTPRIYTLEDMPRAVAWSDVERALAGIDRDTEIGCRDYAMLTLIAYCGLRAGDVAALRLEHIDWRRDTLHAPRPKSAASDDIPLIPAVGEPLVAYLRRRPDVPYREVFLKVHAPITPLPYYVISNRARFYLARAGVKASRLGSHTLRHSLAVELLQRGHPLKTIGDVLGHRHAQSTFIYTKADVAHLREVALGIEEIAP